MKRKLLLGLSICASIIFTGCSYKTGSVEIDSNYFKTLHNLKNKSYEEIGSVSHSESGWLFSSCSSMGEDSLRILEAKARASGADAVVNVTWRGDGGAQTNYPQCHTAWGWVFLWPAWFIPGTSDTVVSGTMIKYNK